MMAVLKAKLKTTRRITGNPITVKKADAKPGTRAKKASAKKSVLDKIYEELDLSGPDDQEVDGEDCLRSKMNRLIEKRSIAMAKKLGQKAEEGNVTSAKLILELVSKNKNAKKPSSKMLQNLVGTFESDADLVKPATPEAALTKDGGA
jgi:hypothetical protein